MGISLAQHLPSHDPLKNFCLDPNQASNDGFEAQLAVKVVNIKGLLSQKCAMNVVLVEAGQCSGASERDASPLEGGRPSAVGP
ncbi:hypothetical protein [Methylobacterium sp. Leaf123]|uniref:hypothetical protein n=1 Tax=Methylobacterium sp. Leaf123 TaxID=1736264 RepID=UPI0012E73D74|nr:hypothetical protein [Methylobacterium sp. Leaf123]